MYKIIRNFLLSVCYVVIQSASFASPSLEGIQIYQKNLHLSEERKQKLADDIDRYHNADNLWDELRAEFSLPHYEDNPYVQDQINWFMRHPAYVMESANRAGPYLYFILQQARMRHLPAEVVLLPMIESAYNPFAYSSAGAAGIWQMMPNTASGFGIKQDWWFDGRRDVVASTRAALDYLVYLGSFFEGNWLLALGAYDTGEGNILSAIKRNVRDGKSTSFWFLPVAEETREYVPRLLALASIITHPEKYPVNFPSIPNAPYLAQMDIGGQIQLTHAATLAGLSLKKLKSLNPGYNRPETNPRGPSKLILPIENVEQFSENLARSPRYLQKPDPLLASALKPKVIENVELKNLKTTVLKNIQAHYNLQPGDTLYMTRKGDTIEKIAHHFHTDASAIYAANPHSRTIHSGDKLIIPTHITQQAHHYMLAPGDTIYMVRKEDTLDKIATKFHTSPSAIRVNNLLTNNKIQEGDRLVIPTPLG